MEDGGHWHRKDRLHIESEVYDGQGGGQDRDANGGVDKAEEWTGWRSDTSGSRRA